MLNIFGWKKSDESYGKIELNEDFVEEKITPKYVWKKLKIGKVKVTNAENTTMFSKIF
jgi:hypothetical protein